MRKGQVVRPINRVTLLGALAAAVLLAVTLPQFTVGVCVGGREEVASSPLSASAECLMWTAGGAVETGYYIVVQSHAPRLWWLFGDRPILKPGELIVVRRKCDGKPIGFPRTNGRVGRSIDGRTVQGIDY